MSNCGWLSIRCFKEQRPSTAKLDNPCQPLETVRALASPQLTTRRVWLSSTRRTDCGFDPLPFATLHILKVQSLKSKQDLAQLDTAHGYSLSPSRVLNPIFSTRRDSFAQLPTKRSVADGQCPRWSRSKMFTTERSCRSLSSWIPSLRPVKVSRSKADEKQRQRACILDHLSSPAATTMRRTPRTLGRTHLGLKSVSPDKSRSTSTRAEAALEGQARHKKNRPSQGRLFSRSAVADSLRRLPSCPRTQSPAACPR